VSIEVQDATGLTRQITHDITVRLSNDSPVISVEEAATVHEDGPAVLLAPAAELYDPDSTAYPGGHLVLGGAIDAFEVTLRNQGTGEGEFGVAGNTVTYGGIEFGTIQFNLGKISRFDFNAAATREAVQALVRNILVRLPNDAVETETVTIRLSIQDEDLETPAVDSLIPLKTVGSNDTPRISDVITVNEYVEGAPTLRFLQDFELYDPDPPHQYTNSTATISILNGEAGDRLSIIDDGYVRVHVSQNWISHGGVVVASYSGGVNGEPLQIQFNNPYNIATSRRIERVLGQLGFFTTANSADPPTRTIQVVYADSAGATATLSIPIDVIPINSAPFLDNTLNPALTTIPEDALNPANTQVLTLLKGAVDDPDDGALRGIAVTAASNFHGTWQYTLNGGDTWVGMSEPSSSEALLLPGWARVRFLPELNFNGTVKLFYRAWDQTAGTAGGTLNVSGNTGGNHSLSVAGESASLWVKPINDAPVLDTTANPILDPVWEDAKSPAGTLVSKFAAAAISDVDAGARKGIAVTSADSDNGKWQFSLDGGKTWQDLGFVLETSARLLPADAVTKIRFIPNADFDNQVSLVYRAWDRTEGIAGQMLSTSTRTGGTGTFSSAFDLATLTMVARNDRPVLKLGSSVGYVRDAAPITLAPNAIVVDVDSFDFDGGWLRVHIADGASDSNLLQIGGEFTIDDDNNVLLGSAVIGKRASNGFGTNDLLIEFKPAATRVIVQQLVRSILFKTVGGSAGTRGVQFSLSDGDGGVSAVAEKTVNVS
jgi:hypothetical protein